MTAKEVAADREPKWLRPIELAVAEALGVEIDPALAIEERTAYLLEQDSQPMMTEVTVFMTSNYNAVLAAEVIVEGNEDPYVLIRAATGDEAICLLSTDDDEAESACETIVWQERWYSVPVEDSAVILWCGEVLLNCGRREAGPFYTHPAAAEAWAFSTALRKSQEEVCAAQITQYFCARSVAGGLVAGGGDTQFTRLNRSWSAPLRPASVLPVRLPGVGGEVS